MLIAGKKFRGVRIENLHLGITEENIFEFFALNEIKAEKVEILVEEISRSSKGVAFVKFPTHEFAVRAMETTGTFIFGQQISVFADDTLLLS